MFFLEAGGLLRVVYPGFVVPRDTFLETPVSLFPFNWAVTFLWEKPEQSRLINPGVITSWIKKPGCGVVTVRELVC